MITIKLPSDVVQNGESRGRCPRGLDDAPISSDAWIMRLCLIIINLKLLYLMFVIFYGRVNVETFAHFRLQFPQGFP